MTTSCVWRRPRAGAVAVGLLLGGGLLGLAACNKDDEPAPVSPAASTYRAQVAVAWANLQLRLVRTTPPAAPIVFGRPYGYTGIVAYEAVVPGMAGYRSLGGQLNGLGGLPTADPGLVYSWPLSANAALAAVNRSLFAAAVPASLAAIDSLEALQDAAQGAVPADVRARSVQFGQQVAAAVLAWARTDGFDRAAPYTPPAGPGLWTPTPPALLPAGFPHWGQCRPLVVSSTAGADPGPPPAYSAAPGSPFYLMAQEVLTVAQTLTPEQRAIALFWNDQPTGRSYPPPGHWLSILSQVLARENPTLDQAALAYAKLGLALNDAAVGCFQTKYTYNLLRPISYIRGTLNQPAWNSLLVSPNFPEYSSAHATISGAAAAMLTDLYGPTYAFTDENYVPFGLGRRSFPSFEAAAAEAAVSRLYGGIHYRLSCERGLAQGQKIAQNINAQVQFR